MLDLSLALNCLEILRGRSGGDQYRIGIVKASISGQVSQISGIPNHLAGQIVLFRDEMTPTDGELQMGEYSGMTQKPTGRVTIESPITQAAIDKNISQGSGIVTVGTMVCVPRRYIEEVKL